MINGLDATGVDRQTEARLNRFVADVEELATELASTVEMRLQLDEQLSEKIQKFRTGQIPEDKFKHFRLTRGVYGQRQLGVEELQRVEGEIAFVLKKCLLGPGITAKDMILYLIGQISTSGGVGYCVEYTGVPLRRMLLEEGRAIMEGLQRGMEEGWHYLLAWEGKKIINLVLKASTGI